MSEASVMLPIEQLLSINAADAAPGTLLLRNAAYGGGPYLVGRVNQDDDPRSKFGLPLTASGDRPYTIGSIGQTAGIFVAVQNWRLLVDPETSFTGFSDTPQPGDAFISGGRAGLMGRWNHSEAYVTIDGDHLGEPNYSGDFTGFRSWSIVVETARTDEYHTVISRSRDKPVRG